jgi:hypothetical protein
MFWIRMTEQFLGCFDVNFERAEKRSERVPEGVKTHLLAHTNPLQRRPDLTHQIAVWRDSLFAILSDGREDKSVF